MKFLLYAQLISNEHNQFKLKYIELKHALFRYGIRFHFSGCEPEIPHQNRLIILIKKIRKFSDLMSKLF